MAQLKKYNVTVNKYPTVLQLDEKGAKARGLTDKDLVKAPAPAGDGGSKGKTPANKSATPANKSGAN